MDSAYFARHSYIGRGISGQTTPQMLIRFKQDVIDLKPKVVVILAGTNDIAGNTSGFGRGAVHRAGEERHRRGVRGARREAGGRRRRGPRRGRHVEGGRRDPLPVRWCSPPAGSKPTPRCVRAISDPAGTSRRCAAPASTPATESTWRSISARCPRATGRGVTRWGGIIARRIWRSRGRRQFPEALLPVRDHGQRRRQAVLRRGRRLPQLHLCQIRAGNPEPAAAVRLANLQPRSCICCATNTASARSQRSRPTPSRSWPTRWPRTGARSTNRVPRDDARLQRGRDAACRSIRPSRTAARRRHRGRKTNWAIHSILRRSRLIARPAASRLRSGDCGSTPMPGDRRGQKPIPGLYAAGELVGGLFYFNYPGGTGLMSGSVFGRIAGATAGRQIGRNI